MKGDVNMQLNVEMPSDFESQLLELISKSLADVSKKNDKFPPYLNKEQAADLCTVSQRTFDNWRTKYHVPQITVGGTIIFEKKAIINFLKEHEK